MSEMVIDGRVIPPRKGIGSASRAKGSLRGARVQLNTVPSSSSNLLPPNIHPWQIFDVVADSFGRNPDGTRARSIVIKDALGNKVLTEAEKFNVVKPVSKFANLIERLKLRVSRSILLGNFRRV